jgi:hypothetical protein
MERVSVTPGPSQTWKTKLHTYVNYHLLRIVTFKLFSHFFFSHVTACQPCAVSMQWEVTVVCDGGWGGSGCDGGVRWGDVMRSEPFCLRKYFRTSMM